MPPKSKKKYSSVLPKIKLGPVLGEGDQGTVYQHPLNDGLAVKILKGGVILNQELKLHRKAMKLGITPYIHKSSKNAMIMDRITPVKFLSTRREQIMLVKSLAKLVRAGILHNDLHVGNVGVVRSKTGRVTNVVIYDFGLAREIKPPTDVVVFEQIVLAQLYAMADPCNINNSSKNICANTSYILDMIYAIRRNEGEELKLLHRIFKTGK